MTKSFRERLMEDREVETFKKIPLRKEFVSEEEFKNTMRKKLIRDYYEKHNRKVPVVFLDGDEYLAYFLEKKELEIKSKSKKDKIEIGMILLEIKSKLGHGKFMKWVNEKFPWSRETARRMMKLTKMEMKNVNK